MGVVKGTHDQCVKTNLDALLTELYVHGWPQRRHLAQLAHPRPHQTIPHRLRPLTSPQKPINDLELTTRAVRHAADVCTRAFDGNVTAICLPAATRRPL